MAKEATMPNSPPDPPGAKPAEPDSRPQAEPRSPAGPQDKDSVYGGQWGHSGKQNPDDPERADPRTASPASGA
jgi:hypothetical protein